MDKQRRLFISRMSAIAAATAFSKPLIAIGSISDKIAAIDAAKKMRTGNSAIFLQDPFLSKELADALCTLIVLGYAQGIKNCTFQYEGGNKDMTKATKEKAAYETVQKLFKDAGVNVNVNPSVPAKDFPFVVALNKKIANISSARAALSDDYADYLRKTNNNANAKNPPPVGAYIGGMSTISKLFIVGPSKLDQYKPSYRLADDNSVKTSFENAKFSTNNAIKAIAAVARPTASEVTHADLNSLETGSFSSGSLYKSYHGMIQAMVNYQSTVDTNSFIFEIALGENTTKVSSCFACSAYMVANNTPASSTHLGRADNWNIPPGNDAGHKLWAGKIADWYKSGKNLFVNSKLNPGSNIKKLLDELGKKGRERDIHNIFLEALTFEASFTDRIINTLTNART